ncbi:MAG: HAD family phosphatase [Verrucomicrobiales bacterium]|nr:HAD family phosphatase [Verrucomicrobiales bacterium]
MPASVHLAAFADPRLGLPEASFQAILFDCDGTLVDTMPLHYIAWTESLQRHHAPYPFSEETFYSLAGVREQDTVLRLNAQYGADVDPEAVAATKSELFLQHIPEVRPIEPVAALARAAHGRLPLAVVSGSEEEIVRACLKTTGLLSLFSSIVTPQRVRRGKPAPDMFLLAAEELGVDPAACLVLEDGQSGIDAATAAGMTSVFIPRSLR